MSWQIVFEDTEGNRGSVNPNGTIKYKKRLNKMSEGKFSLFVSKDERSLFAKGTKIYIYKDDVLDWKGIITRVRKFSGGQIGGYFSGYEKKLADEAVSLSSYTLTASELIANDIISESSYFSAGTIDAGIYTDFRVSDSWSVWTALTELLKKTGQDLDIIYSDVGADKVGVINHLGDNPSGVVLNENIDISNVSFTDGLPLGTKVIVYGKGDGENQIKAVATDPEATETIVYPYIDRSIMSESEASEVANALLSTTKLSSKEYSFEVVNSDQDIELGDVLVLNAPEEDVENELVRVIEIERMITGEKDTLSIVVSNSAIHEAFDNREEQMAKIEAKYRNDSTFMQGSGNTLTFGAGINAKSGASLKIPVYVSSVVKDEVGKMRINSMTLDYDVDPYKRNFGSASFDGSDPQVQNSSGYEDALVSGLSGGEDPAVDSGTTAVEDGSGEATAFWVSKFNGGDSSYSVDLPYVNGDVDFGIYHFYLSVSTFYTYRTSGFTFTIKNLDTSTTWATGTVCKDTNFYSVTSLFLGDVEGDTIQVSIDDNSGLGANYTYGLSVTLIGEHTHGPGTLGVQYHSHSDGSFLADNHSHPNGAYDIDAADLNHISVGDDVSESGSINSTSVSIYLDFWDGSSWINKYSILNTGKTLDEDVDLTNGGTYPDTIGWWRVRIEPNSTAPDFVQGIVTIKHNLDN
ncbi:MAG: hypothetical protein PWQ59_457 [Thermoanaerobacterium sp.]|nr:hypothetical protein [Thermoanaerobacterium sp.]